MTSVNRLRVIDIKTSQISQKISQLNNDSRTIQILLRKITYKKTMADEAIAHAKNHIASITTKDPPLNLSGMSAKQSKDVLLQELKLLKGQRRVQEQALSSMGKLQSGLASKLVENKQRKHQLRILTDRKDSISRNEETKRNNEIIDNALNIKNIQESALKQSSNQSATKINEADVVANQQLEMLPVTISTVNEHLGSLGTPQISNSAQVPEPSAPPRASQMVQIDNATLFIPPNVAEISLTHTLPTGDSVSLEVSSGSAKEISVSMYGLREESRRVLRTKRNEISQILDQLGFYQPLVEVGLGGKGE